MLQGFTNASDIILVVYVVVVLMPAILVCPSKSGLYCGLFAVFVSTGDGAPGVLDDWVEEHATKKIWMQLQKIFFSYSVFFDVKWYLQEWCYKELSC